MKIFEITEAKVEMCPDACCGKPVTECACGPDCKHCDCHAKNKMNEDENLGSGMGESATAGATSAGSIATVANPPSANAKIKRKNGVPIAPQKKNKDGTAKNALELGNNLMGGGSVKR